MTNIVIIDRNEDDIADLEGFLLSYRYDIQKIIDIKTAVQTLSGSIPDLIIMELNSKDPESLLNFQSLKRSPLLKEIPVIPTLKSNDRIMIENLRKSGLNEFFVKPLSKQKLIETIKHKLNKPEKKDFRTSAVSVEQEEKTVIITFKLNIMKYIVPQLKNIFSPEFLKTITGKEIAINISELSEVSPEEIRVMTKVLPLFGTKKISLIAGKHLQVLKTNHDLSGKVNLYAKKEDYLTYQGVMA